MTAIDINNLGQIVLKFVKYILVYRYKKPRITRNLQQTREQITCFVLKFRVIRG